MEKKQKQILIGVGVLVLLYYLTRPKAPTPSEQADDGNDLEDTLASGGGSGGGTESNPTYQPTGDDSSDSQSQDPTSPILDYKPSGRKPSVPLVGDLMSGSSGKPSIGKPSQTNVSNRRPTSVIGSASKSRVVRGLTKPTGGGSYFK